MEPVTLSGKFVRLEPLSTQHRDGICAAIRDGELWKLEVTLVPHPDDIDAFLATAKRWEEESSALVFATIDAATGNVVGSTRFMNAKPEHKRVEIGFTFIAKSHQRTRINTEAKLLMLAYAFETLDLNRVEFLTDYLNTRSRQAISRLGAKEEGVLRKHMLMRDDRVRDSVAYSIVKSEWQDVKKRLVSMLR